MLATISEISNTTKLIKNDGHPYRMYKTINKSSKIKHALKQYTEWDKIYDTNIKHNQALIYLFKFLF